MINKQNTLDFVQNLIAAYFGRRDMGALLCHMEERISWIGTGQGEICHNLQEAVTNLNKEAAEYGGSFDIMESHFEFVSVSDSLCIVYGELAAIPEDNSLSQEDLRITILLRQTSDGLRLIHIHFSHPDMAQEYGSFFVKKSARMENQSLRIALDSREQQLANLTKNIPGGAHQCENDPNLTMISMSDSFLTMFGYTREEVHMQFQDKFINMVYPSDRAGLLKSTYEQLKHGPDIELEYRVLCRNGTPVWVLDKGRLMDTGDGKCCFYCLLMEITDRKHQQEELRLSLERHQVIMNQATDIIFEWDICQDTLSFSANWYKKFGYEAINDQISHRIPLSENIHPDDITSFIKIMQDTATGTPYSETEFRIRDITGRYIWCRIRATAQYDPDARPIKAVGVIVDIDEEKKQKQALMDQVQRDALTGLYNKSIIKTLVEQRMLDKNLPGFQALLIIDVDAFKSVNDTYGHLCGDAVLSDMGAALRCGTRSTDLVGRIGGDEFLVYLPAVKDDVSVHHKVAHLLDAIHKITPIQGAPAITCSIGGAIFPRGTVDYYTLYRCADKALYQKKKNGRNGAEFFSSNTLTDEEFYELSPSAVSNHIVSDEANVADEGVSQYAFRTLYEADDIECTIHKLLEILGRSFDVSRVYIFESSADGTCCSNTFEWCNEGVIPQIDQLQNIAYVDDLGDYIKNFDTSGMFYCHDIKNLHPDVYAVLEPQGIRSMLQCAMLDEGHFVGYVGFDECRENCTWNARQISAFKLTADVLSTFLIKMRQKEQLGKTNHSETL